jgi:hypothetical protein
VFNPSREQVREFFLTTWREYRAGRAPAGLQATALPILIEHPEYHALLEDPETARLGQWGPEDGQGHPFLHLSMHLAIEEQRAIDQPAGVQRLWEQLAARYGDAHRATHEVMECLGTMLWEAQRNGRAPDAQAYLACLQRRLRP